MKYARIGVSTPVEGSTRNTSKWTAPFFSCWMAMQASPWSWKSFYALDSGCTPAPAVDIRATTEPIPRMTMIQTTGRIVSGRFRAPDPRRHGRHARHDAPAADPRQDSSDPAVDERTPPHTVVLPQVRQLVADARVLVPG